MNEISIEALIKILKQIGNCGKTDGAHRMLSDFITFLEILQSSN